MSVNLSPLSDLGEVQIGPFGSILHKSDYVDGGVPLINPMHIVDGAILPDARVSVSLEKAESLRRYTLKAGDIILGRRGEMGRAAEVAVENQGMLCGTGSMVIRANEAYVFPRYLARFLRAPDTVAVLERAASGVTMPNLNAKALSQVLVPLPPLDEQKRIAAILDKADALRRARERAVNNLDDLAQSLFYECSSDDFHEVQIGDVAFVRGGKRLPKGSEYSNSPTRHPYIRVSDMTSNTFVDTRQVRYIDAAIHQSISRYTISPDDVMISIAGSIGRVNCIPQSLDGANLTENAAKIVQKSPGVFDPFYLMMALRQPHAQSQIASKTGQVTIGKLALYRVEQISIRMPPIERQVNFRKKIQKVIEIQREYQRAVAVSETFFTSLQHRAFAGEL